jgi:hypothetical protein
LIERIFQNKVELTKQDLIEKPKLFLSKMRPNNGILEVGFDENIFSQFLRSYDYGLFKVLGDYHLQLENGRLIRAYDYNIHSILNFSPKFKNRIVIEKQNLIFEIKL